MSAPGPIDIEKITDTLVIAAADGKVQSLLDAIAKGVPAQIGPHWVSKIMGSACWDNQLDAVLAWLPVFAVGFSQGNAGNSRHEDPLETAADKGFTQIVDALLPKYAPGGDLDMALYCAASHGHAPIVHRLLAAGADPLAVQSSALSTALRRNQVHIVDILAPLSNVDLVLLECRSLRNDAVSAAIAYQQATRMQRTTPPIARPATARRI